MMYEQFVAEYMTALECEMTEEMVTLTRGTFRKVNEELDGITVKYPDSPVAPTIYLESKYQMVNDGSYTVDQVAEQTAESLRSIRSEAPEIPVLTAEAARQNLYCVVINAADNEEMLRNVPHENLEDLAIVPRFRVGENASFIVTNDMCGHFKMTSEEILEIARMNTEKQNFECKSMADIMREIMREQGMPDDYVEELLTMQAQECPMFVLSSATRLDGAVALASSSTMEAAYETVQQDYPDMEQMYVIGSSRHELILVPDIIVKDVEELRAMHKEVQAAEVSKSDKLTEHVYRYDARTKKLSIADVPAISKDESMSMEVVKSHAKSH